MLQHRAEMGTQDSALHTFATAAVLTHYQLETKTEM